MPLLEVTCACNGVQVLKVYAVDGRTATVRLAAERIDVPTLEMEAPMDRVVDLIDNLKQVPTEIADNLPFRRPRRGPRMVLVGGVVLAVVAATTLALLTPVRHRLRAVASRLGDVVAGARGGRPLPPDRPVAFPAAQTAPIADDPLIPGTPSPYPEGLGMDGLEEQTASRPTAEVAR